MVKSLPQQPIQISRRKRYSLRTLFIVSAVIAVPFLVLANLRHSLRPEDSVASPLYLLLGVAGVIVAAGIGSALGSKTGTFAAAGLAAVSWVGAVYLCGLFSNELQAVLPVHVVFAAATVAVLAVIVRSKTAEDEGPHNKLLRLLRVKHDVQEAQQAKRQDSIAAESEIQNPKSKI
jgi:hypothetical protein